MCGQQQGPRGRGVHLHFGPILVSFHLCPNEREGREHTGESLSTQGLSAFARGSRQEQCGPPSALPRWPSLAPAEGSGGRDGSLMGPEE